METLSEKLNLYRYQHKKSHKDSQCQSKKTKRNKIGDVDYVMKMRFILSDCFYFHMIDNLSIAVYAFTKNTTSHIEQILEWTFHKTAAVRPKPPISKTIEKRRTWHAGHY